MRTGISLPLPFLAGNNDEAGSAELKKQGHLPGQLLRKLKTGGVDSIELRYWQKDLKPETVYGVLEMIKSEGLGFSVHGDIHESQAEKTVFESFPWLEKCIGISGADRSNPLVIAMHPVKTESRTKEGNYTRTIEILSHICAETEREGLPVLIAYENQRERGGPNPAIDYDEITGVVNAVGGNGIGICWDMGHAWANFMRSLIAENPTAEFVKKTVHTHIHDLPAGRISTHWPLVYGSVPVKRYVRMLKESGYRGVYNLELSPEKYPDMDILESFLSSVSVLRDAYGKE